MRTKTFPCDVRLKSGRLCLNGVASLGDTCRYHENRSFNEVAEAGVATARHEAGHALMAVRLGGQVRSLAMWRVGEGYHGDCWAKVDNLTAEGRLRYVLAGGIAEVVARSRFFMYEDWPPSVAEDGWRFDEAINEVVRDTIDHDCTHCENV